jgi:hypothetical protein
MRPTVSLGGYDGSTAATFTATTIAPPGRFCAINPLTSTPDELEKYIPAEIAKWARLVKDAGITPE